MSNPTMRALCAIGLVAAAWLSDGSARDATAATSEPPIVIELFTSQGCSSCPPADALLEDYAKRDGVIALSFHVDYWDYLGWKDRFASADFSARQREYARARGDSAVYTPQAVVNGRHQVVGSSTADIEEALGGAQSASESPSDGRVEIEAAITGANLDIRVKPPKSGRSDADILLAVVQPAATVKIKRGENSGRTITYRNIVRQLTRIGAWDGTAATLTEPLPAADGFGNASYVVLVQQPDGGAILGAAIARSFR